LIDMRTIEGRFARLSFAVGVVLAACTGCRDKQPAPATDTASVAAESTEAAPEAAPPATATRIGRVPLLGTLPPGGQCQITSRGQFSAVLRDVAYTGDYPIRVVKVGVGASARPFRPLNLDVQASQPGGGPAGQDETESISIIFTPDGAVQHGVRVYSTSDNSVNERSGLLPSDTASVRQLAMQTLELCKDHN
jgi:hypothetical protein